MVEKRADGHAYVVFERRLPYPLDDVWRAVAEPAQRAVWVSGIRFDPMPDAPFDIWFGDECDGAAHVSGRLGDFDPSPGHCASAVFGSSLRQMVTASVAR